ncbi:MAG: DMT family transporter [Rubrivivax sp.]|nr:DMT family transporter [Rubrivivax sp.]
MSDATARRARVLLWVVPALWSTNYLIARAAEGVIAPHALAFGRWGLAALLLLPLTMRGLSARRAALRRECRQLLVLGALGMWICGAWMYHGGQRTSATNMALIYAVTPIAIAIVGARLLHEQMRPRQWVGAVLALAGLLVVIGQGDIDRLRAVRFGSGDVWIVIAAISWVAYSVLLKHWRSGLGPAERLVATCIGGLLVMLPFTIAEAWLLPMPPLGWQAAGLVLAAAVLPGVLSYGAYSFLQRELGAARTALMLYLTPVYAPLLAWGLLGEVPQPYHVVGAALILPSIALATRPAA